MIRREITPEGLILVKGELRVELHDLAGNIVDGRDPTPAERAAHAQWAAGHQPGRSERLTKKPK